MAFFDEIGKSISGAGQSAVKQAKEVAEITRISAVINENRSRITDINKQLGEQYFSLHAEDPEDGLAELVNEEKRNISENEELQEQLIILRGQQKCPSCGTILSKDALFCASCGSKIVPKGMKECPQCGKMMKEDSAFCTQCGFAFK